MFHTLASLTPCDADMPRRAWTLDVLTQMRDGTIYDKLPYEFYEERDGSGEYIPLRQRRPSVRYDLCGLVVRDIVALVFGERRFPVIESATQTTQDVLQDVVGEARLGQVMLDVAIKGSVGSVAMLLRILRGRVFVDVMDTLYLTPMWQPEAPDTLMQVVELRKVPGHALVAQGYPVKPDMLREMFWFRREWDAKAETWFVPWPVVNRTGKEAVPVVDAARTVQHLLGFVPIVWMTNLPGGNKVDGRCTFAAAMNTSIEIDYQLSQAGRGLKYQSDPLLMIREPAAGDDTQIIRSAANALIVSENGDAKLLEIGGTAANAVMEYVRGLREMALESVGGNRSNADRVTAAQSGRAMELMHQPLVWVADQLRYSYGTGGMLALAEMICRASQAMPLIVMGESVRGLDPHRLSLRWGPWFPATHADKHMLAGTLASARKSGIVSRERAVEVAQEITDAPDAQEELALIASDEAASDARIAAMAGVQTKITQQLPD